MHNAHPYFSLKNLGKKTCIIHGKIQYMFTYHTHMLNSPTKKMIWLLPLPQLLNIVSYRNGVSIMLELNIEHTCWHFDGCQMGGVGGMGEKGKELRCKICQL